MRDAHAVPHLHIINSRSEECETSVQYMVGKQQLAVEVYIIYYEIKHLATPRMVKSDTILTLLSKFVHFLKL